MSDGDAIVSRLSRRSLLGRLLALAGAGALPARVLKNIQLGYNVPRDVTRSLFLQKLYIYLNATDVFTIVSSKYEGFDPERDSFDRGGYHYPIPRVFSLGLNVSF